MRDAGTLQRRRRLMLLHHDATHVKDDVVAGIQPGMVAVRTTDTEAARRQLFQECQGRTGLQLIVEVSGKAHPRKLSLDRPFALIGSDQHCDLRIDHPGVLPQHAYLQWINGRLFCCSLGSSDSQVTAWVDRKPITLGPFRISVPDIESVPVGSADPQSRNSELAADVPQVQLSFDGVEQRDNLWPVDRFLTLIGRGSQCKLRLDHPAIPNVLASLIRTSGSCWLINLGRHPALHVNDQPTLLESLDIGDILHLGAFRAEVSTAPFSLKATRPVPQQAPPSEPKRTAAVRELATRHRQRLGVLNKSLEAMQVYLDAEHLEGVPELKTALQQYVLHAQRHHRDVQEALERLS